MSTKCKLLSVPRASAYYKAEPRDNNDTDVINEIVDIYQKCPFYGYRRIQVEVRKRGMVVNHKRIQRLMAVAGLKAVYPAKNTSLRNQKHKVFDYLLKDLAIVRPNQVWQVDITYIKIKTGFVYLICLIDVFSRKIMGWALSIFLDTDGCLEALDNALLVAQPEIINSDQGCQFTSEQWVNRLSEKGIAISMDGKGRYADNIYIERLWRSIKYELVYLRSLESVKESIYYLGNYITFYNTERPHQSLNYHTPGDVYRTKTIPSKKDLFDSFININKACSEGVPIVS